MMKNPFSRQGKVLSRTDGWKNNAGIRFLLFLLLFALFYLPLSEKLISKTYDIQQGSLSETTIYSPKMIEDTAATQKAKDQAAQQVQPVYAVISMKNEDLADRIFAKLEQINTDDQIAYDQKVAVFRQEIPVLFSDFYDRYMKSLNNLHSQTLLDEIAKQLKDQQYRIPEEAFFKLPKLTPEQLAEMKPVARSIILKIMEDNIVDAQSVRSKVAEMVNGSKLAGKNEREMVQEIVRFVLTPNKFFDEDATKEAQSKARGDTPSIYINKGDPIIKKDERITEEIYHRLDALGLLKSKVSYWPYLGIVIMSSLFVFVLFMFIRQSQAEITNHNPHLLMLVLIYALNILAMKVVSLGQNADLPYIGYLAPVALGTILITILLDAQVAFISSILFSILASIIFNQNIEQLFDFRYGFVAAVVSFVSIFAIHRATHRSGVLKAGIMISLFASVSVGAIILLGEQFNVTDIVLSLAFALSGGLLTVILVIGLLPFFELAFGILSPLKLVELSNPNHPLLRKLLTETPGTYHHSVMVGNLSEAAAEAIGANGLLCRVGSFYHDIGKTKRPHYFIENQVNIENPHDKIEPQLSKSIIIAHSRDGVEMLKDHKIPRQIRDIAEQHHGTTLLKFFFHKAVKQLETRGMDPSEVEEEDYRYPGPKAQTKEAAIVGVADSVEAAVRSLRNPTMEQIDQLVDKIIKSRMDDNQFNECDLTLKELDTVSQILKETLLGIFHSRIEYPEDVPAKRETKGA